MSTTSMPLQISPMRTIADILLQKTEEEKIYWNETADPYTYTCSFGGEYGVLLSYDMKRQKCSLAIKNSKGQLVGKLERGAPASICMGNSSYTQPLENILGNVMQDDESVLIRLFQRVNNPEFKIKLQDAIKILEKL